MKVVAAAVLSWALLTGSADAGVCTSRCTPVRPVVSQVVSGQAVRSLVCSIRAVRALQRLLNRVPRCC